MATLSVNVDHIATLRQARGGNMPDPVAAAALAEFAGADGIIVHLREDRRHIQDRDLKLLRQTVKTRLNFEMAATREMVGLAREIEPFMSTLVPEKREELTTEGGLLVVSQKEHLSGVIRDLQEKGILVSLFIDADGEQIEAAKEVGADFVELHTGHYADAITERDAVSLFRRIAEGVRIASALGLRVNLGHGLNYHNIKRFAGLKNVEDYSIGHAVIARALMVGMFEAVKEMAEIVKGL